MATRTKIKIMDDALLRETLDSEYEKSSQIKLCKYALSLAKHILTLIDYKDMEHPVIQAGYAVNERWQRGDARMHDVRQAGFQIHQLAKAAWTQLRKRHCGWPGRPLPQGICGNTPWYPRTMP